MNELTTLLMLIMLGLAVVAAFQFGSVVLSLMLQKLMQLSNEGGLIGKLGVVIIVCVGLVYVANPIIERFLGKPNYYVTYETAERSNAGPHDPMSLFGEFSIKDDADITNLRPEVVVALHNVQKHVIAKHCVETYKSTITSGNDGIHKNGSMHYEGSAVDIRTKDMDGNCVVNPYELALVIQKELNDEAFDVIAEDIGGPQEHIHMEYDLNKVRMATETAIHEASRKYSVPRGLIEKIVEKESNFGVNTLSPVKAKGVMQLMDSTAKDMGVDNPWNVKQNVFGGTKYMARLIKMFDGDIEKALAAYNWGPGNVKKHGDNYKSQMPKETRDYLEHVLYSSR